MADTFTSELNLVLPEIDGSLETWGQKLNSDLTALDQFAATVNTHIENDNNNIQFIINQNFPRGVIMAWFGSVAAVPAGWLLCDGNNGTPNLSDRFVMGTTGSRPTGEVGGAFSSGGVTDQSGPHNHGGLTTAVALTTDHLPAHSHTGWTDVQGYHDHNYLTTWERTGKSFAAGGNYSLDTNTNQRTEALGSHSHNVFTTDTGGGQAHLHGVASDGAHAHGVTLAVVPPYLALVYIMKAT